MDIFGLFNILKSFNKIRVLTQKPEKILNALNKEKIPVSHVSYNGEALVFRVLNSRISEVNALLTHYLTQAEVVEIFGTQKLLYLTEKRRFLVFGVVFCFFCALFASRFVWKIEIYGTNELKEPQIKQFLYDNGIRQSMAKKDLNTERLRLLLLKSFDSLGDADVTLSGSSLNIALSEKQSPIISVDKSKPADLIATKDAVVSEITVFSGTALVEAGDKVNKGDVLISGIIEYGYVDEPLGETKVHAAGKVLSKGSDTFLFTTDCYEPLSGAEYGTERTYYVFGGTFETKSSLPNGEIVSFLYENLNIKIGPFELPVLYDEKRLYNINDCSVISTEAINETVRQYAIDTLGPKATLNEICYTCVTNAENRLEITASAVYSENIAEEKQAEE